LTKMLNNVDGMAIAAAIRQGETTAQAGVT
jgi:hypothetical protein